MKNGAWPIHLWAILLMAVLFSSSAIPVLANQPQAALFSAYDVINAVNQQRAANGLPPFQVDGSLMAAAQAHSDYQASIGQVTHTGQGGSNAKSRAIAAGYGGGAAVYVSENIYGGSGASAQTAVNWWMGDALHQNTMLSPSYTDAGAGMASNGGATYITLVVGYIAGSPGSGGSGSTVSTSAAGSSQAFIPVQISTPAADGSIVHVVQSGQTLWTIAAAYKVPLPEILQLNHMTDTTTIYPGNKVLVKAALSSPMFTASQTEVKPSGTARPTMTRRPGRTHTPPPEAVEVQGSQTPASTETPAQPASRKGSLDPLLVAIIALVGGGVVLTVVGIIIQKRN